MNYAFEWVCDDRVAPSSTLVPSSNINNGIVSPSVPAFRCATPKGIVASGRKFEMIFEYTPEKEELVESFWRFNILEPSVSIPILLVGSVNEPNITLDRAHLNFKALLLN